YRKDAFGSAVLSIAPHDSVFCRDRETYARRFSLLLPHLMRAAKLSAQFGSALAAGHALKGTLDAFAAACFLLSSSGKVLAANAQGEELLRARDVLSVRHGCLHAMLPASQKLLEAAVRAVSRREGSPLRGPFRVQNAQGAACLLWVFRTAAQDEQ